MAPRRSRKISSNSRFRIGPNELMGCTAIGSSFIGIGRDHWLEMLDNPRKPVAQWYPLMETVAGHIPCVNSEPLPVSLSCLNSRWVVTSIDYSAEGLPSVWSHGEGYGKSDNHWHQLRNLIHRCEYKWQVVWWTEHDFSLQMKTPRLK